MLLDVVKNSRLSFLDYVSNNKLFTLVTSTIKFSPSPILKKHWILLDVVKNSGPCFFSDYKTRDYVRNF